MNRKPEKIRIDEYHELIDGMNDAVFIHDLEGNFLTVNDTATKRLGYSKEELLNMKPQDIDSTEFAEKVKGRIKILKKTKLLFSNPPIPPKMAM